MKVFVNSLTISRIIGTLIFPFIWNTNNAILIIFYVAILLFTDCLDGVLARKCHVQTFFGSIMDSIADKTLGVVLVLVLANYYKNFYFLTLIGSKILQFL